MIANNRRGKINTVILKKQRGALRMYRIASVGVLILLLYGCPGEQPADLEKPLALYYENKLEQALPLFKELRDQHTSNAEIHAWLAETYRRLGMKNEAVKTAERALDLDPCNSFAHIIMANACRRLPTSVKWSDTDTTWIHISTAIECDSTDGNVWVFMGPEAMLRGKYDVMRRSSCKMVETGFLTKAVLAFGRWLLRTLPENAILITNGDMDTFPALAVQATESFRTDVAVVEKEWLGLEQYLRFLRTHYGITLPLQDSQIDSLTEHKPFPENMLFISDRIFKSWLEQKADGSFAWPIALAITVYEDFYSDEKDHFQYAGPFLLWQPAADDTIPNMNALRASLAALRSEDFTGPWVSEQDRSPVRRLYTKYGARNITQSALVLGEELIKAEEYTEANQILNWAEAFERNTELGPVYTEEIARLKEAAKRRTQ